MAFSMGPKPVLIVKQLTLHKLHCDTEIEGLVIAEIKYDVRTSPKLIMDDHEIAIRLSVKFSEHIQNSEMITEPDVVSVHIVDVMVLREVIIYEIMNQK
jgi:hypothetical protein